MHGSPCQDFSISGKQAGGDKGSGTRSSLMYETLRIVNKLKPKYVIWENVKNLLSKKHKHNFDAYIEEMMRGGYKSYYKVLNAKDYGIPQNRERVFTISIRNDIDKDFVFPEKQELKVKLKDMLEEDVDEKYYLSDDKIDMISHWNCFEKPFKKVYGKNSTLGTLTTRSGAECGGLKVYSNDLEDTTNLQEQCLNIKSGAYARNFGSKGKLQEKDYCDTLTASMGEGGGNVPILKIKNATKKGYLEATDGDGIDLTQPNSKTRRGRVQKDSIQTLTTRNNLGVCVIGGIGEKKSNGGTQWYQQDRIYDNNISPTLTSTANPYYPDNQLRIRKLTPCECYMLMGFDKEDYIKASKVNSNAQLYKQAGNSIVVQCLEAILKNLL